MAVVLSHPGEGSGEAGEGEHRVKEGPGQRARSGRRDLTRRGRKPVGDREGCAGLGHCDAAAAGS